MVSAARMTPHAFKTPDAAGPVGIFDSGVGGLSVWREIARQCPAEHTIYVADQAHVPYGPRDEVELRRFCEGITRFLLASGCKAIVVACNTASAAALKHLRECFPHVAILGMEPAVKPAAQITRSRVVGVMATPATFAGKLFRATAGRHASGVTLVTQVCDGLAEQVERGDTDSSATEVMLRRFVEPMLAAGADTIVLACTHYPFALDAIQRIAGPRVTVIDPAPAIARHLGDVLGSRQLRNASGSLATHRFLTTGDAASLRAAVMRWCGIDEDVGALRWADGEAGLVAVQVCDGRAGVGVGLRVAR